MPDVALVALGSNLGNRAAYLAHARSAMSLLSQTRLVAASRIEETAPLGASAQSPYLNQMVALRTRLSPLALLAALQRIEIALGRVRTVRWSPRTIDLDIVRIGSLDLRSPALVLPHPGLATRAFWRREVAELTDMLQRSQLVRQAA